MKGWIDTLLWEGFIDPDEYRAAPLRTKLFMRFYWFIVDIAGGQLEEKPWVKAKQR